MPKTELNPSPPPSGEPNPQDLAEIETNFLPQLDPLANININDPIGLYLKEVSQIPLLTPEKEVELFTRIKNGTLSVLPTGKKETYFMNLNEDAQLAREQVIAANTRLVVSIAKKYIGRGIPFLDLIQDGNYGLMKAVKKFDLNRGHKFSTYATFWIRQAVTRAIADEGRTIRVPVHLGDKINNMLRVQHQITQKLGRRPTNQELAGELGITEKRVVKMKLAIQLPLSLNEPVGDEEDSTMEDFIADSSPSPDETATYNLLKENLKEMLDYLSPREAKVLQLRFGLTDGQAYTLEEVGRKLGITRERVRQIEGQALSRLRQPSKNYILRGY